MSNVFDALMAKGIRSLQAYVSCDDRVAHIIYNRFDGNIKVVGVGPGRATLIDVPFRGRPIVVTARKPELAMNDIARALAMIGVDIGQTLKEAGVEQSLSELVMGKPMFPPLEQILPVAPAPAGPVLNVSGLDPFDPTWCVDTWDDLYEFGYYQDFLRLALSLSGNTWYYDYRGTVIVEDGVLKILHPSGTGTSEVYKYVEGIALTRIALCMKISVYEWISNFTLNNFESDNGTEYVGVQIRTGTTGNLVLLDLNSTNKVEFPAPSDWFVLVIDFQNKVAQVYSKDKQVLAELPLQGGASSGSKYFNIQLKGERLYIVGLYVPGGYISYDTIVDWIGMSYSF